MWLEEESQFCYYRDDSWVEEKINSVHTFYVNKPTVKSEFHNEIMLSALSQLREISFRYFSIHLRKNTTEFSNSSLTFLFSLTSQSISIQDAIFIFLFLPFSFWPLMVSRCRLESSTLKKKRQDDWICGENTISLNNCAKHLTRQGF